RPPLPPSPTRRSSDLELATPLARSAESARRSRWSDNNSGDTIFQTFGLHRIFWPRRRLLHQAGQNLCRRLVQHWMTKDARRVSRSEEHTSELQSPDHL